MQYCKGFDLLEAFSHDKNQPILSLDNNWRCRLNLTAALRYRAMIPLIYVLLVVENIGSFFYYFTKPIETTGDAPRNVTYYVFVVLGPMMLALCLIPALKSKPDPN